MNRNLRLTWIKHCCSKNSQESEGSLGTEGVSSRQVLLMKCTLLIEHLEEKALLWKQKCCQLAGQVRLGVCWLIAKEEVQRGPTFCRPIVLGRVINRHPFFYCSEDGKTNGFRTAASPLNELMLLNFLFVQFLEKLQKTTAFPRLI